jgi:transcriptional regulator with XRE-family HTH domain
VAEAMRAWRTAHGLTQAAAAKRIGANVDAWRHWETGRRRPGPGWRRRLLRLLGGLPSAHDTPLQRALANYRHVHALSQHEAAQRMGVGRRTWQAWEHGKASPGPAHQQRIWQFLDRELREFGGAQ